MKDNKLLELYEKLHKPVSLSETDNFKLTITKDVITTFLKFPDLTDLSFDFANYLQIAQKDQVVSEYLVGFNGHKTSDFKSVNSYLDSKFSYLTENVKLLAEFSKVIKKDNIFFVIKNEDFSKQIYSFLGETVASSFLHSKLNQALSETKPTKKKKINHLHLFLIRFIHLHHKYSF